MPAKLVSRLSLRPLSNLRGYWRILVFVVVTMALTSMITTLILEHNQPFLPSNGVGIMYSRPLTDLDISNAAARARRPWQAARDIASQSGLSPRQDAAIDNTETTGMIDSAARQVQRHDMAGISSPLLFVTYSYPRRLRLGDDGAILLHVTCSHCPQGTLTVSALTTGLSIAPASPVSVPVAGDVEKDVQFIASSESLGLKSAIFSASLDPHILAITSVGSTTIDVVPPGRVFGIPEPYINALHTFSTSIGLPGLIGIVAAYFIGLRRSAS
jgi:hypothetical protein